MYLVRADQLRPGDLVDFERDSYADPHRNDVSFQFEYAQVVGLELETESCLRVDLQSQVPIGMPPEHLVRLAMVRTDDVMSREPTVHADYPHQFGRLHDCPACDQRCWCTSEPGTTECVFEGHHEWPKESRWVEDESFPRYKDAGDVGGDSQSTGAYSRRWTRRRPYVVPAVFEMIEFYVYEIWEKPPVHSVEDQYYQVQTIHSLYTDPADPGQSEISGGVDYARYPITYGSRKKLIDELSDLDLAEAIEKLPL